MKKYILILITFVFTHPFLPSVSGQWRISCVGNSITNASPGYKGPLYDSLMANNFNTLFVGTQDILNNIPGQHSGYNGYTVGPGQSLVDKWTEGRGNIYVMTEEIMSKNPHIVLLMIGLNNFWNINPEHDPMNNPDIDGPILLEGLVDKILNYKPGVTILLSNMSAVEDRPNLGDIYNSKVLEIVQRKQQKGEKVYYVDMRGESKLITGDWKDGVHLTKTGYAKMGNVWYNHLKNFIDSLPPLTIAISADAMNCGRAPLSLSFNSISNETNLKTLKWNFSDGHSASGAKVDYKFNKPGFYSVQLVGENYLGKTDTARLNVIVYPEEKGLVGIPIGSESVINDSNKHIAYAIDSNIYTFFNLAATEKIWYGIDLGQNKVANLTKIAFAPRMYYEEKMVGGVFEASNDSTFNNGVVKLHTINETPKREQFTIIDIALTDRFRYLRYVSPYNSNGNIAEFMFVGELHENAFAK